MHSKWHNCLLIVRTVVNTEEPDHDNGKILLIYSIAIDSR